MTACRLKTICIYISIYISIFQNKEFCLQNSSATAVLRSNSLHLRGLHILAERFCVIGNCIATSYYTKSTLTHAYAHVRVQYIHGSTLRFSLIASIGATRLCFDYSPHNCSGVVFIQAPHKQLAATVVLSECFAGTTVSVFAFHISYHTIFCFKNQPFLIIFFSLSQ